MFVGRTRRIELSELMLVRQRIAPCVSSFVVASSSIGVVSAETWYKLQVRSSYKLHSIGVVSAETCSFLACATCPSCFTRLKAQNIHHSLSTSTPN